jgi:hypothetical protein
MPAKMVLKAWQDHFGDVRPRNLRPLETSEPVTGKGNAVILHHPQGEEYFAQKEFVKPFVKIFHVSTEAMGIRLKQLGLLQIGVQNQLTITAEA